MSQPYTSLKRINFFAGQLLTAADFAAEQEYFRERLRRHNQYCHGWGIVAGLELNVGGSQVTVSPGMALDCYGQEIILPEPTSLALPADGRPSVGYVVVEYRESYTDEVPTMGQTGSPGDTRLQPSRILESFHVSLAAEDPVRGHGPRTACGIAHGVTIGCLRWNRKAWRIDARYR